MGLGLGRGEPASERIPESARLVVPVMAAGGGSGRSTVACLLADALARLGDTVVADLSARLCSPWPAWTAGAQGGGLGALPPDRPLSRAEIRDAAAVRPAAEGRWSVLTDGREWSAAPLPLPADPAAWYQLAAAGGWQVLVADTAHPVAHDVTAADWAGLPGLTRGWCALPYAVPVLCAQPTAGGVHRLQQAVEVLRHCEGMPLQRTVVAFSAASDGRLPAVARAAATMLAPHTAAVVHLPHDADIRTHGLAARPSRIRGRTAGAARGLAAAVLATAREAFGDPLPTAPRPMPAPPPSPSPAV
ncbi:hypothetical protein [Streptomyces sp. 2P-4]|uniref:hypothetical protein n=1 Tax=Streptomyces sp. 2P-4 TaxID=2931974 RepID=UPI0025413D92|nr:hypothetical protein [Streptomyces sp. 2P-4]